MDFCGGRFLLTLPRLRSVRVGKKRKERRGNNLNFFLEWLLHARVSTSGFHQRLPPRLHLPTISSIHCFPKYQHPEVFHHHVLRHVLQSIVLQQVAISARSVIEKLFHPPSQLHFAGSFKPPDLRPTRARSSRLARRLG